MVKDGMCEQKVEVGKDFNLYFSIQHSALSIAF